MKKTLMAAMAAATMIVGSQAAHAASEQGGYVGGQYNFASVDLDVPGLSGKANPKSLTVLGGYNFNKYFAVEGRVGFSASSDIDNALGDDISIDNYFSVLARGTLPVNEMFNVYGVLGFSSLKIKDEFIGGSDRLSDSGVTYGIGAEVNFAKQHGVSLEYAQLLDGSDGGVDFKVTAISVGYRYRF